LDKIGEVLFSRKFVASILALLVLSAPLVACVLPGQQMTDEERDCCQHMSEMCGSSHMADSHSCCNKAPHTSVTVLQFTSKFKLELPLAPQATIAFLRFEVPSAVTAVVAHSADDSLSPPGHNSILRI
jgi:hypothetical protein